MKRVQTLLGAKAIARTRGITARRRLPEAQRTEANRRILSSVLGMPGWAEAYTVAVYWSLWEEVDTHQLIECALADGKTVVLPKMTPDGLVFRQITGTDRLETGAHGIMEPPSGSLRVLPDDIRIVIVPGTLFGRDLYRIGMGGGDFDRALRATHAGKWGLAYHVQMRDTVPHGPYDVPMDRVITERTIYYGDAEAS